MLKRKIYFDRRYLKFQKSDVFYKKIKISIFNLKRGYFIHTGEVFLKKRMSYINIGDKFFMYFLSKKPFSPPIHKILKKK